MVEYIGYGGGRGQPYEWLLWASAGYAHLVMDTRGQGGTWQGGDTSDIDDSGTGSQAPGVMSRGILDPATYYYRRLMTDAVLAIDAARDLPIVDPDRIVVIGASQGGGLALAVAGLAEGLAGAIVDVPFLTHFRRALEVTDEHPYGELRLYLRTHRREEAQVFRTLSYFDGRSFAARATTPALFSVGLEDDITPPSTVFAAYNEYAGPKEIRVWPFSGHEAPEHEHTAERLAFAASRLR
jgi:cephalosporin-C deacetylase